MISLPNLPDEILSHILSSLTLSNNLDVHSFWSRGITPHTLLPPNFDNEKHQELGRDQIRVAKQLCLVSRRLREVFVRLVWSRFQCGTARELRNLKHVCDSRAELGGYVRHLDLRLSFNKPSLSLDEICTQLESIWPRLVSLRSLTLVLTSTCPCPDWLSMQLRAVSTLQTLRLCVFGNLGPQLRALPQIQNLYLEIHPPDIEGNLANWAAPDEPTQVQRAFYHNWTDLFNDALEFIEVNTTEGNLNRIAWFVDWTMVHSFYRHMSQRSAEPPNVKHINASSLKNISRLSLTLESQMGTRPFMDAVQALPVTDLAFTAYGLSLLNGTAFRVFCNTFPRLRRLRIKLKTPSHTIGDDIGSIPEGPVNEEEFVNGLASLEYLEAYKGPVLFRRQNAVNTYRSAQSQGNESVIKLRRQLLVAGVNPEVLFQWHVWLDGKYGPKEYMVLPAEGPEVLGTTGEYVDIVKCSRNE